MKKKKILIVTPGVNIGGTVSSLNSLLNSEFTQKYDVSTFVMNHLGVEKHPLINKLNIGRIGISTLLYANMKNVGFLMKLILLPIKILIRLPKIGKKIYDAIDRYTIRQIESKNEFDIVISYAESQSLRFVQKVKCKNKITWIHCDYNVATPKEVNEFEVYDSYQKIVCVSEFTRRSFCNRYPKLENKVYCVYNILDYSNILEKGKQPVDSKLFDTSHFTIISVGRFDPIKRFANIPEIASKLKEAGLSFKWYIIGADIRFAGETENIKNHIKANDVSDCVIVLDRKSNPYPYFKNADLLVSTSRSEACPMVFNEAKILGTPIVSADFGSAREFIEDGKDGFVTPLEEMHSIIGRLIEDRAMYSRLSPTANEKLKASAILNTVDKILN